MFKLFRIEWMKVKKYRAFWVLYGAFLILLPVCYYFVAREFMKDAQTREEQMLKELAGHPFIFPRVWLSASWFGGLFFVILGMLYILLITNEVQYRTHRQNIIDGWSRFDFLKAKFTMLIFFVLTATVMVFLCGLVVGTLYSPSTASITDGLHYVGYFALMALMYLMVSYVIAILIKRTGLSIIIYFAFVCLVDNILWALLTFKGGQAGYFLPLETTDSLIPHPFKPAIMERRTVADSTLVICAVAYISLFAFFIRRYFQRIDLKT